MHEIWLQKYIKEYYLQIGFSEIHGPYKYGADYKGVYVDRQVKIEAEWDYIDYIKHKHSIKFADVLVVATLEPVPEHLRAKLPSIVINLERNKVIDWAQPRFIKKVEVDYYSYPWRRLSRSLLDLYTLYQKQNQHRTDFIGFKLAHSMNKTHIPAGFQFGAGGIEEKFVGTPDDKAAWDFWLVIAHEVARHFRLKPTLLRPTWIDRVALYFNSTGRMTEGETKRFGEVGKYVEGLASNK